MHIIQYIYFIFFRKYNKINILFTDPSFCKFFAPSSFAIFRLKVFLAILEQKVKALFEIFFFL